MKRPHKRSKCSSEEKDDWDQPSDNWDTDNAVDDNWDQPSELDNRPAASSSSRNANWDVLLNKIVCAPKMISTKNAHGKIIETNIHNNLI